MVSGKQYFTFPVGLKVLQGCVMQFNGICQTIFSILQSFHSLHYAMGDIKSLESLLVLHASAFQLDIISGLLWTDMITFLKLIKYILLGQLIESKGSTDGTRLVRTEPGQEKLKKPWPNVDPCRKHDPYFPVWARYHSHGVGVLFGWFLLEERRNQFFSKFLGRRRGLVKFLIVLCLYSVGIFALYFPIYGINSCFHVEWEDGIGDYLNASTSKNYSHNRGSMDQNRLARDKTVCVRFVGSLNKI